MAIKPLADSFDGDIVSIDDPGYLQAIARWAANAQRKAKFIAYPKSNESVSAAIKWAVDSKTPIAVRGGGHSTSGASSITDGMVIDLSRYMGGVKVDPEKRLAFVGGGALWGAVDAAAIAHGLATVSSTAWDLYMRIHVV